MTDITSQEAVDALLAALEEQLAAVDYGCEHDLQALAPGVEELIAAARWTRTHDPSKGFRDQLERVLAHLGAEDVDLGA